MAAFRASAGDTVQLLTECRSGRSGCIYEIGTRGRVIGVDGEFLALEIVDSATGEIIICPRDQVTHERTPKPRQTMRGGLAAAY